MRVSGRVRMISAVVVLLAAMVVTMAPVTGSTWGPRVTDVAWNRLSQELVLQLEVPRSAIAPTPPYTFTRALSAQIDVYQNDILVAELRPPLHPIETRPGALQTQGRYVPITPLRVPWDRNGGTITGEVTVRIHIQLVWVNNTNRPPSPAQFTEWGILIV